MIYEHISKSLNKTRWKEKENLTNHEWTDDVMKIRKTRRQGSQEQENKTIDNGQTTSYQKTKTIRFDDYLQEQVQRSDESDKLPSTSK